MSLILGPDDPGMLATVREALAAGWPVGLPTGTSYGLAVDPFAAGASDRLFTLMRRPRERDLSVLVATLDQAMELTTALPGPARRFMERCWPGPLTLVLPRNPGCEADLGDDDLTVGLRMTDHPVAFALCLAVGPLGIATAALEEEVLRTAAEVADAFGESVPVVIDGGEPLESRSTVIDASGEEPHLIREGALSWDEALAALKD